MARMNLVRTSGHQQKGTPMKLIYRALLVCSLVVAVGLGGAIGYEAASSPASAANSIGSELFLGRPDRVYNSVRNSGSTSYVRVLDNPVSASCISGVHVNVTAAESIGPGYVTVWGPGSRPGTSTLNVNVAGHAVANAVSVETYISNGDIYMKVFTLKQARIIVDLMGIYLDC